MRVVYRILHFILYSILYLTRHALFRCQAWINEIVYAAWKLIYTTDLALLYSRDLRQRLGSKKMEHVALVFNSVQDDIDIGDVDRVSALLEWLVALKVPVITVFDRRGSLRKHSELIQAMLRIRLITSKIHCADEIDAER